MSLRINNGQVVDPQESTVRKTDLFLQDGKIVGIGSAPKGFIKYGFFRNIPT